MYEQRRKALEQKRRARLEREEAMRAQEYERLGLARGNSRVAVGLVLEEDVDDGGHTSREPAPSSLKPERHDVLRSKYDMILPVCPYSRSQLLRILSTAFRDLPRADQTARKLLSKYHDRLSFAAQQRADGKSTASDDQAAASEGGIATATGTPGAKRGAGKAETTGGGFGVIVARSRQPEASQAHDDSDAMEGVAQELLSKPAQRTAETITKERINRAYQDRADGRKGGIGIPELLAAMDAPTSNSSHIDRGKLSAMAGRDSHMVLAVYPSVPVPTTSTDRLRAKLLERTSQLRRDWENYTTKLGLSRFNYSQTTMVLHDGMEQRFETPVLRVELERELDRLLLAQVFEREQVEQTLKQQRKVAEEQLALIEGDLARERALQRREALLAGVRKAEAEKAAQLMMQLIDFDDRQQRKAVRHLRPVKDAVLVSSEVDKHLQAREREEAQRRLQRGKGPKLGRDAAGLPSGVAAIAAGEASNVPIEVEDNVRRLGAVIKWG
ncbi:unnamed protein product, partial [Symbiodinium sp. KB8]